MRILDTFVRKFGTLKEYTKKLSSIKDDDKLDSPAVQLEFMPFRYGVCQGAWVYVLSTAYMWHCKRHLSRSGCESVAGLHIYNIIAVERIEALSCSLHSGTLCLPFSSFVRA